LEFDTKYFLNWSEKARIMFEDKSSTHIKAAYIGGIFAVIAACIGGMFLIGNTLLQQGFVVVGPGVQVGNPRGETSSSQPSQSSPELTDNLNCQFIDELVTQGDIIQWIDTPPGSGKWSGVQIRLIDSVFVPAGWVVHYGSSQDQHGPLNLPAGGVASIYSPYSCRPLEKTP
jgi:hypothetical protein